MNIAAGRDSFLQRVHDALKANRAGEGTALPERGQVGYQGAGIEPAARFCQELATAGGTAYRVADGAAAVAQVVDLVRARSAKRVLLGSGTFLDRIDLTPRLRELGVDITHVAELDAATCKQPMFAADIGISGVDFLVAETGSLVVRTSRDEPRSLSLLPPVHIAVADKSQLIPDLFDLFPHVEAGLPSCLTLITGPSKTGDIELRLVTGVHGPGEVHVVLIG